jgi:phosphoglycolate phosphatase-like HAD superfamily hydrolase
VSVLVLFDVDGTLIDSAGAGREAIEGALREVYGTAGPIDATPFDGLTDPWIVRSLLEAAGLERPRIAAGLDRLWESYLGRLAESLRARTGRLRILEGVAALLDALALEEAAVGLLTGNIEAGAVRKLEACGLGRRFPFGAFGSDAEDRDALPAIALERACAVAGRSFAPERVWVVGDTPRDIGCARAGGVRALAVASGRYTVDELRACGPDEVAASLGDTPRILGTLTGRAASPQARDSGRG